MDCVEFDSRFLCHLWRTNLEFGVGALQISLCSSPPQTPFWSWCKRHCWFPTKLVSVPEALKTFNLWRSLLWKPLPPSTTATWKFLRWDHYLFHFLRTESVERCRCTEGESFLRLEVVLDDCVGKVEKVRLVLSQAFLRSQIKFCIQRTIFNITNIQFFYFFSLPHSDMWWCCSMM